MPASARRVTGVYGLGLPVRLLRRSLQKKVVGFMETWLRDLKVEAERRAS